MHTTLHPTLWRTCRALANHQRLRMLRIIHEQVAVTVTQMAQELDCPLSETSIGLRTLNARGLLQVTRIGRYVRYSVGADPSVPGATELLRCVIPALKSGLKLNTRVFNAVTALTHYRRHLILYELHKEPIDFAALHARTLISKPALKRHLRKLRTRGMVVWRHGRYRPAKPHDQLRKTLLTLSSQTP